MSTGPSWIIEWFRPDRRRAIIRVAVVGAALVLAGVSCIGVGRSGHLLGLGDSLRTVFWVIGGVCTLGGPLWAVYGFTRATGGDTYLAIRADGVAWNHDGAITVIRWDDLETIEADGTLLVLRSAAGVELRPPEPFDGVPAAELVKKVERTRQRALMGLLRPPQIPMNG